MRRETNVEKLRRENNESKRLPRRAIVEDSVSPKWRRKEFGRNQLPKGARYVHRKDPHKPRRICQTEGVK